MKNSKVKKLTQENFKSDVLDSGKMWMIKFYAPWCYPCRKLGPIWEKAAKSMKDHINFGEVDYTKEIELFQKYKIQSLPTIKFFYKNHRANQKGKRTYNSIVNYSIKKKLNKGKPLKKKSNKETREWRS